MCPEHQCVPVSWQYIQTFLRHFTQNHTCVSLVVGWSERSIYTVYITLKLYKKDTVWPNLSIRDKVLCNFMPLHQDQQLLRMLWSILLIMSRSVERTFGGLLSKIMLSLIRNQIVIMIWFVLCKSDWQEWENMELVYHGLELQLCRTAVFKKKGVKTVNLAYGESLSEQHDHHTQFCNN